MKRFGINDFPIVGFAGKSVVIRVMLFQSVNEVGTVSDIKFINAFGVKDVKVKHSNTKKGSGKRPTLS